MTVSLKKAMADLSPESRKRVNAEAKRLIAEYRSLQQLRKARNLTQVELANALEIKQATVAQMEKRSDLLLSTLRKFIEGMGGSLKLTAEFPGSDPVFLDGFGDEPQPQPVKRKRATAKATRQ